MPSFSPELQLETLFIFDDQDRIRGTREPQPQPGPAFSLVRSTSACAWAVNASVPSDVARELDQFARDEPPATDLRNSPRHADAYVALLGGRVESGPVFTFPANLDPVAGIVSVASSAELDYHFRGWTPDEIPDRSPIVGVVVDGNVVSVCFCARRSGNAAEAGVETAIDYRGRGFASKVTGAWARLIRESGRLALYSTSWNNAASLALARTLGLSACAADWNVYAGAG